MDKVITLLMDHTKSNALESEPNDLSFVTFSLWQLSCAYDQSFVELQSASRFLGWRHRGLEVGRMGLDEKMTGHPTMQVSTKPSPKP